MGASGKHGNRGRGQSSGISRRSLLIGGSSAAVAVAAAEKNAEAGRRDLDQAEEQFRIVQERYAAGRGIQLEILDAQSTLTRAQFNVVAALADHHSALAMWLKATGRVRRPRAKIPAEGGGFLPASTFILTMRTGLD